MKLWTMAVIGVVSKHVVAFSSNNMGQIGVEDLHLVLGKGEKRIKSI